VKCENLFSVLIKIQVLSDMRPNRLANVFFIYRSQRLFTNWRGTQKSPLKQGNLLLIDKVSYTKGVTRHSRSLVTKSVTYTHLKDYQVAW